MARTIDADLLKQNCNITGGSSDNFVVVDLRTLGRVIDNQPTVDAAPVVHGEWKISSDGYYPYCSICNYRPKGGEMTKHCPDCGAKMDGGDKQ